ncbi:pyridoxal phosphate-dependent aminotransferase [Salipiger sp. HF18]|uniref:pyridoxal phosphate-dependent aminotransferase n=1 Tax=Salipiger sp. HF18 TaxID=2721557 RepID=UPI00142D7404|nr:pyridoxal phosphate-dependent aminotransferase [Salipiger sp. HF18]NIY95297.1 pyridoxal phosphate-dependent aminotransferase [Salipiger sp. HF18]
MTKDSGAEIRNRYFDTLFADEKLIWMGQNTNHIPAHPAVTQAMTASIAKGEYNAYAPPLGFESLRAAIVEDLGVPGRALVTEGGVNALATLVRTKVRAGDTFVTSDPTWKWPGLFATQQGAEVIELPIFGPGTGYKLTPEVLAASVDDRCALIYLVDPNNPLGTTYDADELAQFIEIAKSVGALLVHDCTYRDFAPDHVPAMRIDPVNAVCSVSFSKWLGLAGMRVGALVGAPGLIDECAAYSSSILGAGVVAQRGAEAGLRVKPEWMQTVRAINTANQQMIREAVAATEGLELLVWPSFANFLCIGTEAAGVTPEQLVEAYRQEGVMIRQGKYHTARFGGGFIKVSTTVPEDWARRFCTLLPAMMTKARGLTDVPALF